MSSESWRTARPRTPSNGGDTRHSAGLGIYDTPTITTDHDYDLRHGLNDSPDRQPHSHTHSHIHSYSHSPARSTHSYLDPTTTPSTNGSHAHAHAHDALSSLSPEGKNESGSLLQQPFNFVPQQYVAGGTSTTSRNSDAVGKRRGHKYRHSSIHASAMDAIMLPTTSRRGPLTVPASLPMPTRSETWSSMTRDQTLRFLWSLCHLAIAAFVQFSAADSLAMTTLSRLLLFDAAGAIVCVVVDVMGNFEVWRRSSIRHPFGLQRADVLAGFAMAVFIAFMGLDVISHGIQHSLEDLGTHEAHSPHAHGRVGAREVDSASALAIISTLLSAVVLKNHARAGRAMRLELMAGWGKILSNPSHFLTLSCSLVLLVIPFLDEHTYSRFDIIFSFLVAATMIAFGVRLGSSLASMLLMSYGNNSPVIKKTVGEVIQAIETDSNVSAVDEARFWQVHYGLCMANLKLRCRLDGHSGVDEMTRIRQRVESMIRQRFGGGGRVKWEITTQLSLEKD